jgi:hypothetical protein
MYNRSGTIIDGETVGTSDETAGVVGLGFTDGSTNRLLMTISDDDGAGVATPSASTTQSGTLLINSTTVWMASSEFLRVDWDSFDSDGYSLDYIAVGKDSYAFAALAFAEVPDNNVLVVPGAAGAVAESNDPVVSLGSVAVSDVAAGAVAESNDPAVVLGAVVISGITASVYVRAVDSEVVLGSILLVSSAAAADASSADPSVIEGSGSVVVTPSAEVVGSVSSPVVVLGSLTLLVI